MDGVSRLEMESAFVWEPGHRVSHFCTNTRKKAPGCHQRRCKAESNTHLWGSSETRKLSVNIKRLPHCDVHEDVGTPRVQNQCKIKDVGKKHATHCRDHCLSRGVGNSSLRASVRSKTGSVCRFSTRILGRLSFASCPSREKTGKTLCHSSDITTRFVQRRRWYDIRNKINLTTALRKQHNSENHIPSVVDTNSGSLGSIGTFDKK